MTSAAGNQNGGNDRQGDKQEAKSHHVALAGGHRHQHDDEADQDEEPPSMGEQPPRTRHDVLSPVGNVHRLNGLGDDVVHRTPGQLSIGGGQHPMRQH
jgi:hypothetical protein